LFLNGKFALRDPSRSRFPIYSHETYYPRFGFAPASRWNLTCDYGESDAFQFLSLTAAANELRGAHIRYAPEFGEIFGLES
jgi:putative acetyltransferase